jgi:hypothetical protein
MMEEGWYVRGWFGVGFSGINSSHLGCYSVILNGVFPRTFFPGTINKIVNCSLLFPL